MFRVSDNWKTNVFAGAHVEPLEITKELERLAIKSAQVTKTEIAGVDILESENGYQVIEVNSIPGFMALQEVTDINIPEQVVSYFLKSIK
jgi:glutathione synthase/RimK-type ligase-like ATP-grasp enzyme